MAKLGPNPLISPIVMSATEVSQSMALDTKSGDLYFGWYDSRANPRLVMLIIMEL